MIQVVGQFERNMDRDGAKRRGSGHGVGLIASRRRESIELTHCPDFGSYRVISPFLSLAIILLAAALAACTTITSKTFDGILVKRCGRFAASLSVGMTTVRLGVSGSGLARPALDTSTAKILDLSKGAS